MDKDKNCDDCRRCFENPALMYKFKGRAREAPVKDFEEACAACTLEKCQECVVPEKQHKYCDGILQRRLEKIENYAKTVPVRIRAQETNERRAADRAARIEARAAKAAINKQREADRAARIEARAAKAAKAKRPNGTEFTSLSPTRRRAKMSAIERPRKEHLEHAVLVLHWMSYKNAAKYLDEAARLGVSEVARSRSGFMGVYKKAKTAAKMKQTAFTKTQTWGIRRDNFVKRHMAQYVKNPTYRRWLALVMWAYKPPGPVPEYK